MVTRNIQIIESDLSGEPGAATTLIGLKGEVMELDLTAAERAALDEVFAPCIARGRNPGTYDGEAPDPAPDPSEHSGAARGDPCVGQS